MSMLSSPYFPGDKRWNGLRVGLLGGSFNPPHEGHVHISQTALTGLKLDAVWWLVTPQNPLKDRHALPFEERVKLSRALIDHPRILVTDIEQALGTNLTYHSVRKLKKYFPKTDFVWISGMDNALSLHTWNHWQALLGEIAMVHLSRNPARSMIRSCPLRMLGSQKHVFMNRAAALPLDSGTTYWMMQKKIVHVSSTEIRENSIKSGV